MLLLVYRQGLRASTTQISYFLSIVSPMRRFRIKTVAMLRSQTIFRPSETYSLYILFFLTYSYYHGSSKSIGVRYRWADKVRRDRPPAENVTLAEDTALLATCSLAALQRGQGWHLDIRSRRSLCNWVYILDGPVNALPSN